jgi:hypothetical protein
LLAFIGPLDSRLSSGCLSTTDKGAGMSLQTLVRAIAFPAL